MKKTKTKLIILGTAIAVLGVTAGLLLHTRPDSDDLQKSGTELVSIGEAADITMRKGNITSGRIRMDAVWMDCPKKRRWMAIFWRLLFAT